MLRTPVWHEDRRNPVLMMIASINNNPQGDEVSVIEPGAVIIGHWSLDMLIWGGNAPKAHMKYPDIEGLGEYGVCDSPTQFLDAYRTLLADDPRTFCVSFTHVAKDPDNRGKRGGWRWHKWGAYVGVGQPTCEYLDDEEGFSDGVYCYHIYQTDGPNLNWDSHE